MAEALDPVISEEVDDRAHRLLQRMCERDWRVATAESCTGGLLAALLTDVPGCSHAFERGFVAYTDQAKSDLLGIARSMVDDCGAVSRQVAEAMALGALDRSDAQITLSVTGFAGPGGEGDEEGLVHFACASEKGHLAHREEHFGPIGRAGVRLAALEVALDMMERAMDA